MDQSAVDASLFALGFARKATLRLLEDIPESQWLHPAAPGLNHTAWIIGHIAWADSLFARKLGGRPATVPENWHERFGTGSTPRSDRSAYPSADELRTTFGRTREELMRWLRSLSADELLKPLPEAYRGFASCPGTLGVSLAWHEGLHSGQLAVIRRTLGLPPKIA
jgi:hypothetical protein